MAKQTRNASSGGSNRRFTRGGGRAADWSQVDETLIRDAIVAASMAGGAIRFGLTSDGGAYAIGVYGDGDKPYTEYVRPNDDIEGTLRELEAAFLDIHAEQTRGVNKAT